MNLLEKKPYNPPFPNKNLNKSLRNFSNSQILQQNTDPNNHNNTKTFKHTNFANKDLKETIQINAHPNGIKNYMYNNSMYFDLKNWKEYNKPTRVTTKVQMRSTERVLKEPLFKDRKESKKLTKLNKIKYFRIKSKIQFPG